MKRLLGVGLLRLALLGPLMAFSLVFCGCGESEDTDSDITATRFYVDRQLENYSDTDEFPWETVLNEALVTVRIYDFHEGDTSLKVYDGRGTLIFSEGFSTRDNVYFTGDDFFFQRRTALGVSGTWRVVMSCSDFTGDINVTME